MRWREGSEREKKGAGLICGIQLGGCAVIDAMQRSRVKGSGLTHLCNPSINLASSNDALADFESNKDH
jgi:hypothetical protein